MLHRIVLVRHGRSGHVHRGLLNVAQFHRWREAYEAAGLMADEVPPAALREVASSAGVLAASNAPRAIASAKLLAPERPVIASELLRELDLHPPDLGSLRLPLIAWVLLIGFRSKAGPHEITRAREAASWLSQLSEEHGVVVAVTHGSVRRLIARELQASGWRHDPPSRRIHHWSAWGFGRS